MKRIIIGSIVGAVILFACQAGMWIGGFHKNFSKYTPKQEGIMQNLNENLGESGLYAMPFNDPDAEEKGNMDENVGKPFALVFYSQSMTGMGTQMPVGLLLNLMACFIAALILYYGYYPGFGNRWLVSMGLGIFSLVMGGFTQMNWWQFPWSFVLTQVLDMTLGWGITSLWLAWYVRRSIRID